ncbi:MAG: aldo/keto reductase [Bacteroidia bacterium]|nr:aldo/keto reductase [Bacteroidia bacterium]
MNRMPVKFSKLIIGTMRLGKWGVGMDKKEYQAFIEGCMALGLNDFDHADIYGDYTTEKEFGEVLKDAPSLRDEIQITTKCGIKKISVNRPFHKIDSYDSSSTHIINSVHNSLRNLNTDYIDVLLIHRPDLLMHAHEVAETFAGLKKEGKVNHFGVSNFLPHQFELLNEVFPLCTNQVEASAVHLDPIHDGTLDQCQKYSITPTIWSPLGGGKLFDKSSTDKQIVRIRHMASEIMEKHDASLDQVLLAWLMRHPSGPIPVLGTSKLSRIKDSKKSLDIHLTREEWYQIYTASTGKNVA